MVFVLENLSVNFAIIYPWLRKIYTVEISLNMRNFYALNKSFIMKFFTLKTRGFKQWRFALNRVPYTRLCAKFCVYDISTVCIVETQ